MSITYIGIIVALLSKGLEIVGVNLGTPQLTSFIETFGVIVGGIIAFIGRYRAGGITIFGTRTGK